MDKQLLDPPGLHHSRYYTQVVSVAGGRTVYVSGQWACNAQGELLAPDDVAQQARLAFANLRTALAAAGATPQDVVRINLYVAQYHPDDLAALDAGVSECFGTARGFASTLVGVQSLARAGMRVEVDAIAVTG